MRLESESNYPAAINDHKDYLCCQLISVHKNPAPLLTTSRATASLTHLFPSCTERYSPAYALP